MCETFVNAPTKSSYCLLYRCVKVSTMGKNNINVINLQPFQTRPQPFNDMLARKSQVIDAIQMVLSEIPPEDLCAQDVVFPICLKFFQSIAKVNL